MRNAARQMLSHRAGAKAVLIVALFAFSACEVAHVPPEPSKPAKFVMGYYAYWEMAEFDHTKVAYQYLTHVAHAFAWPDFSGTLVVPPGFLYPALNDAAHAAGVKMILSLGGWGNCAGFPGMSSVSLKCQYVKDKRSAGVIIWELSEDYRSGNSELLEVIGKSFGAR